MAENDYEVCNFEVVFTDGERRTVEGTRLIDRSGGGISIIDERKEAVKLESEKRVLQYNVLSVPEQTLKCAYRLESAEYDRDNEASVSDNGQSLSEEETQGNQVGVEEEEDVKVGNEEEEIWGEEDIEIDDDIKIS